MHLDIIVFCYPNSNIALWGTQVTFQCGYDVISGRKNGSMGDSSLDNVRFAFALGGKVFRNGAREIPGCDNFKVLPHYIYPSQSFECEAGEEKVPPIELLIGAAFMAEEGWTMDFSANIIYRLKAA